MSRRKRRAVGNIERIRPGVYKVTVTHGRNALTGKRRRKSKTVYGDEYAAESYIPILAAELGCVTSGETLTLRAWERVWREDADVRDNTRNDYERTMRLHILPYIGDLLLPTLKPLTIRQWMKALTRDGASPHVVAHAYRVLRACLKSAVKPYELVPSSPTDSVEAPDVPDRDLATLTADEANAYLDLFAGHPYELAVMLALTCGMRRSEIAALDRQSLRGGVVQIRRGLHQSKGGGTHFEATKSKRSRRDVRPPDFVLEKWPKGFGPLFPTEDGGYTAPDSISQAYERHIRPMVDGKKAERVRYIPLRDLRHSAASLLLELGLSMEEVRDILGHEDIRTTQTFYDKSKRSDSPRAAGVMQQLRRGQKGASVPDVSGNTGD